MMRRMGVVVFVSTLACQPLGRGIDVPPSVITGTVRNDIREPVPFALVGRDGVRASRADPDAAFRLLVQSGATVVHASQDIDNDGVIDLATVRRVHVPAVGDRAAFVLLGDVALEGTFAINGRVVDDQGVPVAGAQIVAVRRTSDVTELTTTGIAIGANNDPLTAIEASATTDIDGNYRLTGLARGTVQLMANDQPRASALVTTDVIPPEVTAPDVVLPTIDAPSVDVSVLIVPSVAAVSLSVFQAGELDVVGAVPVLANVNATQLQLAPGLYDVVIDGGPTGRARLLNQVVPSGEPAVLWSYALLAPVLPPFAGTCAVPEQGVAIQAEAVAARAEARSNGVRCLFPTCDGQPIGSYLEDSANFDCTIIEGDLCLTATSLGGDLGGVAAEWLEGISAIGRHLTVDGVNVSMPSLRAVTGTTSITDANLDAASLRTTSHLVLSNGTATTRQPLLLTGDGPLSTGNDRIGGACSNDGECGFDRCVDDICVPMPLGGEPCVSDQCSLGLSCEDGVCAAGTNANLTIDNSPEQALRIEADVRNGALFISNSNAQRIDLFITGRLDSVGILDNANLQTVAGQLPGNLTALAVNDNPQLVEVGFGEAAACAAVVSLTNNPLWCQATDWAVRSVGFTTQVWSGEETAGTGTACEQVCGDVLVQGDEVCDDGGIDGFLVDCDETCSSSSGSLACTAGEQSARSSAPVWLTLVALARRRARQHI
jgi:hypothetical protein